MRVAGLYTPPSTVDFSTILDGECFAESGVLYIKVKDAGAVNAINMSTGSGSVSFLAADPVIKMNSNVTAREA